MNIVTTANSLNTIATQGISAQPGNWTDPFITYSSFFNSTLPWVSLVFFSLLVITFFKNGGVKTRQGANAASIYFGLFTIVFLYSALSWSASGATLGIILPLAVLFGTAAINMGVNAIMSPLKFQIKEVFEETNFDNYNKNKLDEFHFNIVKASLKDNEFSENDHLYTYIRNDLEKLLTGPRYTEAWFDNKLEFITEGDTSYIKIISKRTFHIVSETTCNWSLNFVTNMNPIDGKSLKELFLIKKLYFEDGEVFIDNTDNALDLVMENDNDAIWKNKLITMAFNKSLNKKTGRQEISSRFVEPPNIQLVSKKPKILHFNSVKLIPINDSSSWSVRKDMYFDGRLIIDTAFINFDKCKISPDLHIRSTDGCVVEPEHDDEENTIHVDFSSLMLPFHGFTIFWNCELNKVKK